MVEKVDGAESEPDVALANRARLGDEPLRACANFRNSGKGGLLRPPAAVCDQRLHYCRCSAVVAVHWPRSLVILWTSNMGSPESFLTFLPDTSTRSPGFRVSFACWRGCRFDCPFR